ncbi:MAG TPA: phosphatase PAP2 family protein [Acetobacteraceae bacterium]|nr:phosphatase PAP2 family protein [Acetobacteraceae bacterium]
MKTLLRPAAARPSAADGLAVRSPRLGLLPPALVLAGAWAVASGLRTAVDYPVMRMLNRTARAVPSADRALAWLSAYYLLSGALLMALVWYAWFARPDAVARARLLAGTVAAFAAGMMGRVLQLVLPTHPRPMHDAVLAMTLPDGVDPTQLNHWSSFPSDHAAVQFGLAAAIGLALPRAGWAALAWVVLLNANRVYLGVHFPTDVVGGAALGVLMVQLAQTAPALQASRRVVGWERRAPGGFYGLGFFISYQVATLFDEARTIAGAAIGLLRHLLGG